MGAAILVVGWLGLATAGLQVNAVRRQGQTEPVFSRLDGTLCGRVVDASGRPCWPR